MTSVVSGELRFDEAGLLVCVHRLDDIFDVAVEEGGQVVAGVADAVVGHPVLGEVVGTDLLGALAGADLGAAGRLDLLALPALLGIEEAGAEDGHRLVAVLELGALVLADGDDAGGDVGDADGSRVLLDVLAAVAAGVDDIDPQLLLVDMHVHVVGLRQHGDGGGGGVDAAAGLGDGDALDAVDAALVLEARVGAAAAHLEDDLLEAAAVAGVGVQQLYRPALALRVAAVHAVEIGGEEGGLLAAGGGAHLHDDVLIGEGILWQQGEPQLLLEGLDGGLRLLDLLAGEGDELRVAAFLDDAAGAVQRVAEAAQLAVYRHDVFQRGVLAGERLQPLVVAGQFGAGHLAAPLFVSRLNGGKFVQHCLVTNTRRPPEWGPLGRL